ncbi:uncharacterized protein LOC114008246 [Tupaia chinensis]|uniref:uncharacterized protein LOC114008246 n=1 Tax=Tupaia chinensis TaxID=246437 RepID=UPI000FFB2D73|nr:uncharacterized protein LOC114008246 [Tupaia chinensis]
MDGRQVLLPTFQDEKVLCQLEEGGAQQPETSELPADTRWRQRGRSRGCLPPCVQLPAESAEQWGPWSSDPCRVRSSSLRWVTGLVLFSPDSSSKGSTSHTDAENLPKCLHLGNAPDCLPSGNLSLCNCHAQGRQSCFHGMCSPCPLTLGHSGFRLLTLSWNLKKHHLVNGHCYGGSKVPWRPALDGFPAQEVKVETVVIWRWYWCSDNSVMEETSGTMMALEAAMVMDSVAVEMVLMDLVTMGAFLEAVRAMIILASQISTFKFWIHKGKKLRK